MKPPTLPLHDADIDRVGLAVALADALCRLPAGSLPLQAGCLRGGWADDSEIEVSVLGAELKADRIVARVGVFFSEVIGGCNCADDPVAAAAHLTLEVRVDRQTGEALFAAAAD